MPCDCRSDSRALALLARNLDEYPELSALGPDVGWHVHRPLGAVRVEVGSGCAWSGVAEVSAFLRTVLDDGRFGTLRAAWLENGRPLEDQVVALIHARPLAEMTAIDSSALAALLTEGRVETWFQPIFWAGTLEVWGYECLMRGRSTEGEVIGAGTLLEWARQEHLAFMLDRTVRELHLRSAGRADTPPGCSFLINFLPTAIYRPEFCLATTVRAARESGLDADRIVFEVVETERLADRDHLRRILSFYRDEGFRVALDDVGTGWAGLTLLGDLEPDLVKISRELVSKAVSSPFHREICAALVRLGQEAGEMVLAEGVETEEEWKTLEALGVNLFQGFLFGRPAPQPAHRALVEPRPAVLGG
ncbi:MAG TPA: EAL domain-containing protein [Longimicrobium sp.]|nr:EAL domain-containing protein [Longimicrobium sp.]